MGGAQSRVGTGGCLTLPALGLLIVTGPTPDPRNWGLASAPL